MALERRRARRRRRARGGLTVPSACAVLHGGAGDRHVGLCRTCAYLARCRSATRCTSSVRSSGISAQSAGTIAFRPRRAEPYAALRGTRVAPEGARRMSSPDALRRPFATRRRALLLDDLSTLVALGLARGTRRAEGPRLRAHRPRATHAEFGQCVGLIGMCRNIRQLHNFEPPATADESRTPRCSTCARSAAPPSLAGQRGGVRARGRGGRRGHAAAARRSSSPTRRRRTARKRPRRPRPARAAALRGLIARDTSASEVGSRPVRSRTRGADDVEAPVADRLVGGHPALRPPSRARRSPRVRRRPRSSVSSSKRAPSSVRRLGQAEARRAGEVVRRARRGRGACSTAAAAAATSSRRIADTRPSPAGPRITPSTAIAGMKSM